MTTASNLTIKLTTGQLFHLGVLCEDHDEVMADREPITDANLAEAVRRHVAVQAPIVRLLFDAGVTCKDFGKKGYDDYHAAFMLSTVVMSPDFYPPGSGGHEILIAAGIRSTDPATWPADDDTEGTGHD